MLQLLQVVQRRAVQVMLHVGRRWGGAARRAASGTGTGTGTIHEGAARAAGGLYDGGGGGADGHLHAGGAAHGWTDC